MLKKEYEETLSLLHDVYLNNLRLQGCVGDEYVLNKYVFVQIQDADNIVDILKLLDIEDMNDFFYSSYLLLLHRTPDEEIVRHWELLDSLDDSIRKKKLLTSLLSSPEFIKKGQLVCNNPWDSEVRVRRILNYSLMPVYRALPRDMQKVIKSILRRKE
ncbi:MAG: hypothetical protein K5754_10090 [Butyrivibrio sp.]|jgi:hypothetical protein|nr:hypothetical protein [Butyrivibrio sp.]